MKLRRADSPTVADLVLAFRQAKKAIANERGGVGLLKLAKFEMSLASNLRHLRRALLNDRWFDRLEIGQLIVMPKSAVPSAPVRSEIVRVGVGAPIKMRLGVRMQLEPTPEFAIAEVLYLWEFGGALEAMLSKCCVGYRLKSRHNDGVMDRFGRDVYAHWPTAFASYRDDPIRAARNALTQGKRVVVVSTDVVSFFDSLNPEFLVQDAFIKSLDEAAKRKGRPFSRARYKTATRSLLRKYSEFRSQRQAIGGKLIDVSVGVPIGSLISRVFANVAFADVDTHIQGLPQVLMYRRYVDDIVAVSTRDDGLSTDSTKAQVLATLFPGFTSIPNGNDSFVVPTTNARFELNESKTCIHELFGTPGIDFLGAVQQSFSVVTSERRAFLGDVDRLTHEIESVDLFGQDAGDTDRIPRLRDADRFTLRRFMATAFIRGLERAALLLDKEEASAFLIDRSRRMLSILDGTFLYEDFELVLSLLKVALLTDCVKVVGELLQWLRRRTDAARLHHIESLSWRGKPLPRSRSLRAMLTFLTRRVAESIASARDFSQSTTSKVLSNRSSRDAALLWRTDLRYLDREDDIAVFVKMPRELSPSVTKELDSVRRALMKDKTTRIILTRIRAFIERSHDLHEKIWSDATDVSLLLSVKPPRYSDVARRFLARAETSILRTDIGQQIDECVDALRGTRYSHRRSAFSARTTPGTFCLHMPSNVDPTYVRVALANLPVGIDTFRAAALGTPLRTLERLRTLDRVLRDARRASYDAARKSYPMILVFPELSIPARWTRDLAEYAVSEELSIVAGVEYTQTASGLANQAMGVFPAGRRTAVTVRWTKRNPARGEEKELVRLGKRFMATGKLARRVVLESEHGRLGVLVCSEILEASSLSELASKLELLLVPAWNDDTWSFDHMTHASASLLLHSFVCVANNAEASDSRIVAPIKEPRWARDWCRLIHRGEAQVIWGDLPVAELRHFHEYGSSAAWSSTVATRRYRPLPPGWKRARKNAANEPF